MTPLLAVCRWTARAVAFAWCAFLGALLVLDAGAVVWAMVVSGSSPR